MSALPEQPLTLAEWHQAQSTSDALVRLLELSDTLAISPDCAWISVASREQVQQQWDELLSSGLTSETAPLYGVPFAIKDNIDAKGFVTTAACPKFAYTATDDAFVVKRLRAAGAILVGKTNLDQFATGLNGTRSPYGATPNSFDSRYVSGGSSAGSASVVARGLVPFSLGTDTAGSGRVPAGLNNIIGVKPTPGSISTTGLLPACRSLDCISIFALTVEDAEMVLRVASAYDEVDAYAKEQPITQTIDFDATSAKFAICSKPDWFGDRMQEASWDAATSLASSIGWNVKQEDFTQLFSLAQLLYEGPWVAERYAAIQQFIESSPEALDPTVKEVITKARNFSAMDYFKAQYVKDELIRQVNKQFAAYDALLVPTSPTFPTMEALAAEPILENSRLGSYTNFVNFLQWSALSIPAGFREDGLPFGITIISRSWSEENLFRLARYWLSHSPRRLGATNKTYQDKHQISSVSQGTQKQIAALPGTEIVVVGAHLSGMPLNTDLTTRGATLVKSTKTSPHYRLYELTAISGPRKPGLERLDDNEVGHAIDVEVWSIPSAEVGGFLATIAPSLAIGRIELSDGQWLLGFVVQAYALTGAKDISTYRGWRHYLAQEQEPESQDTISKTDPKFEKILIANRGEISVRIAATLKKLNIQSVSIYSEDDRESEHVAAADHSVLLKGATLSETYLNAQQIVDIAKSQGADAIIPGYGFLSENAEFATLCEASNIVWIGPTPEQMQNLGLKHKARELAKEAGIPLVPGSALLHSLEEAYVEADRIGYPIMLKSTAGGGGIGLYMCSDRNDLADKFEKVKQLGKSSFNDDGLFLERFIRNARHIEVQILGNGRGKVKHAGERDCSLQRRNQKVIEESPATFVPESVRAAMRTAAIHLGQSLHYRNVGTVEFIYDSESEEFFFLEVNTRLQVEHPVTEATSGLDLVECMIHISHDGFPSFFDMPGDGTASTGHCIEARIYAESPLQNFRPSHGKLLTVSFPSNVRVDTWIRPQLTISSSFDPLLAKVIAKGETRAEAIAKLHLALSQTKIVGVETNLRYVEEVVRSAWFSGGDFTTKTLDSFVYREPVFEVLDPGSSCSVQDLPGRLGYWNLGIPPSGPMDDLSFRIANRIVGNDENAAGLECTMSVPRLKFHTDATIAVCGGAADVQVDNEQVPMFIAVPVYAGQTVSIGALKTGFRVSIAVRGGLDVPEIMGSKSTLALGKLGGHNGRNFQAGDLLRISSSHKPSTTIIPRTKSSSNPSDIVPIPKDGVWQLAVLPGPHGSPTYFTTKGFESLFESEWSVHYNSNRLGVRLIGPKPEWARKDGGEAGIHPSNIHDSPYAIGSISFTGDEAVILTCDGPSLGGFCVFASVLSTEMWKVGQMKPGDRLRLVPVHFEDVRDMQSIFDTRITTCSPFTETMIPRGTTAIQSFVNDDLAFRIVARLAGDHAILFEYGDEVFEMIKSLHVFALIQSHKSSPIPGVREFASGVRSLQVFFAKGESPSQISNAIFSRHSAIASSVNSVLTARVVELPLAFDDAVSKAAIERYQKTIRSEAPWLPSNIDFLQKVNGVDTRDVIRDVLLSARYLVLGLGDVYLGSPCCIPLDPKHRLFGTKYNPPRSFTPEGSVGIGGQNLCIYGMESPGGYQLVGRTVPVWNARHGGNDDSSSGALLEIFDQISFYPVTEAQLLEARRDGSYLDMVKITTKEIDLSEFVEPDQTPEESESGSLPSPPHSSLVAERLQKVRDLPFFHELIKPYARTQSQSKNDHQGAASTQHGVMVRTPMPGRCWKRCVSEGDDVNADDVLVS